jgi:hypothetical protein
VPTDVHGKGGYAMYFRPFSRYWSITQVQMFRPEFSHSFEFDHDDVFII